MSNLLRTDSPKEEIEEVLKGINEGVSIFDDLTYIDLQPLEEELDEDPVYIDVDKEYFDSDSDN